MPDAAQSGTRAVLLCDGCHRPKEGVTNVTPDLPINTFLCPECREDQGVR